jgi:hypothetical protein
VIFGNRSPPITSLRLPHPSRAPEDRNRTRRSVLIRTLLLTRQLIRVHLTALLPSVGGSCRASGARLPGGRLLLRRPSFAIRPISRLSLTPHTGGAVYVGAGGTRIEPRRIRRIQRIIERVAVAVEGLRLERRLNFRVRRQEAPDGRVVDSAVQVNERQIVQFLL